MLKYALLATAIVVSAPAAAQDIPGKDMTPPASQTAPARTDQTAPTPPQTVPIDPSTAQPADPAAAPDSAQAVADASSQAVPATQIADVVAKEFPSYDKNGDGKLSETEFGAWMVALKTVSDPSTKATAPATRTWIGQAFAQADTDKSKSLSQTELTGFLAQG